MTEKIVFKTGLTGAGQDGIYLAAGSPGAGGAGGDGGSNGAAGSPGLVRLIFVLPTGSPPRCGARAARRRAGVAPPTCGHTTLMGTPQTSPAARPLRQRVAHAQDSVACANWRPARVCSSPEDVIDCPHLRAVTSCKRKAVTRLARPANLFCSNEVLISSGRKSSWESPIRHVIMNSL